MPLKAYFAVVTPLLLALIWLSGNLLGPGKPVPAGDPQVFRILTTQATAPQPWRFERYVASFPGESVEAMASAAPAKAAPKTAAKQPAKTKNTKVAAKHRKPQNQYAYRNDGFGRGYDAYAQMRGGGFGGGGFGGGFGRVW